MTIRGRAGSYNWSKPQTSRRYLSAVWAEHGFRAATLSVTRMFRSWCWESPLSWSRSWSESDYDGDTDWFSQAWSNHQ